MESKIERCYTATEVGNMISSIEDRYGDEWGPNGITALEDLLGIDHFTDEVAEWARTDHELVKYVDVGRLLELIIEAKQIALNAKNFAEILMNWVLFETDDDAVVIME